MQETETIIVQEKAFEVIESAVHKMVKLIKPTYGPAGNKVIIKKPTHRMTVDDGVQIARDFGIPKKNEDGSININQEAEQAVIDIIKGVAIKTNDRMGDGTTSSLIMLEAIISEVAKKGNKTPRATELELQKGLAEFKEQLKSGKKEIKTKADLKKVALISFDNEPIAEMIADTYSKIGKDGIIAIEKSSTLETTMEFSDGVKLSTGYISQYMVNTEKLEVLIEKPYILITDYRLTENSDIFPIMEKMAKAKKQGLVVISDNVEQHALATLITNLPHVLNPTTQKLGTFSSVAIPIPPSENRETFLEDLALLTGATLYTKEKGNKLENLKIEDLGRAERIISSQDQTVIFSPKGKKADIASAITSLRTTIDSELDQRKKDALIKRLGLFTNTVATIKVGALTDEAYKALKYKVEDVVNATKVAYKGGVVCGAGLALSRVKTSSPILNEALKYPSRQLRKNMGLEEEIELKDGQAHNVVTDKTGDFISVGVVDPVDVLIAGVESAVSIASLLITTPGILVEYQKPQNN